MRVKVRVEIDTEIDEDSISSQVYDRLQQNLLDDLYVGVEDSIFKDLKIRSIHPK